MMMLLLIVSTVVYGTSRIFDPERKIGKGADAFDENQHEDHGYFFIQNNRMSQFM
jgi:hypothetical protein